MTIDDLAGRLRRRLGERDSAAPAAAPPSGAGGERPAALAAVPASRRVDLDVRDALAQGDEPLPAIMRAVARLGPDRVLALRVPFEPVPLYDVLGRKGFLHWAERTAADDWTVWFYRAEATPSPVAEAPSRTSEPAMLTIDVRGLEAPQPMVRILEQLDRLAPGQRLEVLHDRRPMFLYPQIEERGFTHETDEPGPGIVRIVVTRGA